MGATGGRRAAHLLCLAGHVPPQLDAPVAGGAAARWPVELLLQSDVGHHQHVARACVVDLPLLDEAAQGPVHGGRGVSSEAEAGELRGQPLDDVGHVGRGPRLSELQQNATDGIV